MYYPKKLKKYLIIVFVFLSLSYIHIGMPRADTITVTLQNGVADYDGCEDAHIFANPEHRGAMFGLSVGGADSGAYPNVSLMRYRNIQRALGEVTTIVKAELMLYLVAQQSQDAGIISAYRVLQDWDEEHLDDNGVEGWLSFRQGKPWKGAGLSVDSDKAPEDGDADRASTPIAQIFIDKGTGKWYSWDITDAVKHWHDGSWKEYGVALIGENAPFLLKEYFDSEHGLVSLRPKLVITHVLPDLIKSVDSCDIHNSLDNDEVYHSGQSITISVAAVNRRRGLKGTIQISAPTIGYDSGPRALEDEDGIYEYIWHTTNLDATKYNVTVTLMDMATKNQDTSRSLIITLDNTPPEGKIAIDNQAEYTLIPDVSLTITAEDSHTMFISGDVEDTFLTFQWVPYTNSLSVVLTKDDGEKKVEIKFQDKANNESDEVSDTIKLVQNPPIIANADSFDVDNPADGDEIYHAGQNISIKVTDNNHNGLLTGAIRITSANGYDSGIQKLTNEKDGTYTFLWVTSGLKDGEYRTEIKLSDIFGRADSKPADGNPENSFKLTISNVGPKHPRIIIMVHNPLVHSRTIKLSLSADNAVEVFIDGDVLDDTNTFEWIPLEATKIVNLAGEDGEKTVRAKFRNASYSQSDVVEAKVRLESKAPLLLFATMLITDKNSVLSLFFDEPLGGVNQDDFSLKLYNHINEEESLELRFGGASEEVQPFLAYLSPSQTEIEAERFSLEINSALTDFVRSWEPTPGEGLQTYLQLAKDSVFDTAKTHNADTPSTKVQFLNPALLARASVEPQAFSPNGDGIKDQIAISYLLYQEGETTIVIENAKQITVYERVIPNQNKGTLYQEVWDGRKNDRTNVPDGVYSIKIYCTTKEISDSRKQIIVGDISVTVDTQAPKIISISPLDGAQIAPQPEISAVVEPENAPSSALVAEAAKTVAEVAKTSVYITIDLNAEQQYPLHVESSAPGENNNPRIRYELVASQPITPYPFTLSAGGHTVTFHAVDVAGNYAQTKAGYMVASGGIILSFFNYPNPFTNNTQIVYSLSQGVKGGELRIYNSAGNLVFYQDVKEVGSSASEHKLPWDGRNLWGKELARGVYFGQLRVETEGVDAENEDTVKVHKLVVW